FPATAVGVDAAVDDAAIGVARRLEDDGAGAIAEEDATAAVFVVGDAAEDFRADDQDVFVAAGLDEVAADFECVEEAGAGGGDVEAGRAVEAEGGGDEAGGRG